MTGHGAIGPIEGAGALAKSGAGNLLLSGANSYAGPTTVAAGGLYVNGDQSAATGATTALSGATLGGTGTIGGDVAVADGATLSPGNPGPVPGMPRPAVTTGPAAIAIHDDGDVSGSRD